jgi:hypothetical protein
MSTAHQHPLDVAGLHVSRIYCVQNYTGLTVENTPKVPVSSTVRHLTYMRLLDLTVQPTAFYIILKY